MTKVDLKATPTFLRPGQNTMDFIKYKFLLASSYIYSSESEIDKGTKPMATHYIYNETDEMDVKATKLEKKNDLLRKIADLSSEKRKEVLTIILEENMETQTDNYMTVKFDDILKDGLKTAELAELLENSGENIKMKAFIKRAIGKNHLKKTKQGIFYFDTNLGYSEEDVKEFLMKPENQEIFISIKEKTQ
jgi:hypothetical protein